MIPTQNLVSTARFLKKKFRGTDDPKFVENFVSEMVHLVGSTDLTADWNRHLRLTYRGPGKKPGEFEAFGWTGIPVTDLAQKALGKLGVRVSEEKLFQVLMDDNGITMYGIYYLRQHPQHLNAALLAAAPKSPSLVKAVELDGRNPAHMTLVSTNLAVMEQSGLSVSAVFSAPLASTAGRVADRIAARYMGKK